MFDVFFPIMVIIGGVIVAAISIAVKQVKETELTKNDVCTTSRSTARHNTAPKSTSEARQPMASHLDTNYHSSLNFDNIDSSTEGAYATVDEIADAEVMNARASSSDSIVDVKALYHGDHQLDLGNVATVLVLGEILGAPKSKRR